MAQEISLHDLRRLGKTKISLADKELRGKFTSRENVREALLDGLSTLDAYDTDASSLSEYNVVDEYRNRSQITVYEEKEHTTVKRYILEIETGHVEDKSHRVMCVDFVMDGNVVERLFVR